MRVRTPTRGWLPKQHGVWAMLVVPFAAGTVLVWQDGRLPSYVAPLFATWILGYFTFNSASGLLKSAPARRSEWWPAFGVYCLATLTAGLLTVWEAGPSLWWWLAGFGLPLLVALWLAARRDERNLVGGLLTVLLAAAMVLVVRFPDPLVMLDDVAFRDTAILAAVIFGYLSGTVFHIKAMIRQRRRLSWRNAAIAWHALWTLIAAVGVITGYVGRWWPLFFLITTIRAWLLPVIAERRRVTPLALGIIEIVLSLALLAIAVVEQPIG